MDATSRSGPWRATSVRGEVRVAEQGGPDHGPGGPGAEGARDRLGGPESTADLDLHPAVDLGDDGGGQPQLARLPCPCAVEIHDVQPAGPRVRERTGDGDGIVPVGRLLVEVAPAEAHHATVDEVDRGQQLELGTPCSGTC